MNSLAQDIFDKTMANVPQRHRKLTFAEAKDAVEKKMTIMTREPFQKILPDQPRGFDTFEHAVAHLRKLHGCSGTEAMRKAADRHPDLLRKYNDEGRDQVAKAAAGAVEKAAPSHATQEWNLLVDGIMMRRGVKRSTAMQIARSENPGKYRAYMVS